MPVTRIKSRWASGDLIFEQVTSSATWQFGINGTGLDVQFFGDNPSSYMLWDESANNLDFATGTNIDLSAEAAMIIFAEGATTTKTPTADAPAGWLNVHVVNSASTFAVPYYAIT